MRHWSPVAWLFIVNAVAVCVLLLAAVVQARSAPKQICVAAGEKERIDAMVQRGVDRGLEAQVQQLYQTWVRDVSSQQVSGRSAAGLDNAVQAYLRASKAKWEAPLCP